MTTTTYEVDGMTCGHCVASITRQLDAVPGVERVAVDLTTQQVAVTGRTVIDDALVVAAVAEAGYAVTGRVG